MKKKILLVEDDPFLVDIYSTKLKKAGFKIEVVRDGSLVLDKLKEVRPDLVVLDIVLPNFNGWEVLTKIQQKFGANKFKIIILSNLGQKSDIQRGLSLGAVKYLIKARYTPSEIVEEIKKVI